MPFSYKPINISPLELNLDIKNPRFLTKKPNKEDIIRYLLKSSHLIDLAKSIRDYGALYPGERIVIYKNIDGEYIVLEGNRRICACQLFLNPKLIPTEYQNAFPKITVDLKKTIKSIDADLLTSRNDAESFLASRHIGGVELWDPLAKRKFFVDRYENGLLPATIAQNTNYPKNEIINDIREYYLFMKAYNLPCWTQQQKANGLNIYEVDINKFIRIFNTKGAKKAIQLKYDDQLQPESSLPPKVFEEAIKRVMYCAYITNVEAEKIDTRTRSWENVPGLKDILEAVNESGDEEKALVSRVINDDNVSKESAGPLKEEIKSKQPENISSSVLDRENSQTKNPQAPIFFENLSWAGLDPKEQENSGLIALASEIKKMSTPQRGGAGYTQYPIAATVLLRSILEQTLKYNIKKTDNTCWRKISQKNDPALKTLINEHRQQKTLFLPENNMERLFNSLFGDDHLKDFLDLTTHHPSLINPSAKLLEDHSKGGLYNFVHYILNKSFHP